MCRRQCDKSAIPVPRGAATGFCLKIIGIVETGGYGGRPTVLCENASGKSRRVVHKGVAHAYLAARRGRKDRTELRGGDKREGVLTGLAAIVADEVTKLAGIMRLTV